VVGYSPFFFFVIHKEGLCPSSGDVNGLMMIKVLPILLENGEKRNICYSRNLLSNTNKVAQMITGKIDEKVL
jgi:hypothetical protein